METVFAAPFEAVSLCSREWSKDSVKNRCYVLSDGSGVHIKGRILERTSILQDRLYISCTKWMETVKCTLETSLNGLISDRPLLYLILNPSINIRGIKFPLLIPVNEATFVKYCHITVQNSDTGRHGSMHCRPEELLPKLDAKGYLQTFLSRPSALE